MLQVHSSAGGTVAALPSDLKYSSMDFHLMVSRNQDEIARRICEENQELKECLKALQKEMFDIVDLKTAIYRNRFEAELHPSTTSDGMAAPFDVLKHDLDRIRDELFSLPFEQAGRELVLKFQRNFQKLRDFMERVDKDIAQLAVFNVAKKGVEGKDELDADPYDYGLEDEELSPRAQAASKKGAQAKKPRKFKGISSVAQLKHLLRSYDALVEGQHALLNNSITKIAKIPSADEISNTFERFQILKDSELDEMRSFINEHRAIMQSQYRDFEVERRQFEDLNHRMEGDKVKISEERERIETEVRKIRELNREMSTALSLSAK